MRLMSDFRLTKIAPFIEKDARTLRRWCEAGLVPGAYRSEGGHWRISGKSLQDVIRGILAVKPKFSRRRSENAYPSGLGVKIYRDQGMTPRQAWKAQHFKLGAQEMIQRAGRKVGFVDGEAFRVDTPADRRRWLVRAARLALDAIEKNKELEERMIQERIESLPKNLPVGYFTKGCGPRPKLTVPLLAQACGVSVRTFYRWFPNWRKVLRSVWGEVVKSEESFNHDDIDHRLGWIEPPGSSDGL